MTNHTFSPFESYGYTHRRIRKAIRTTYAKYNCLCYMDKFRFSFSPVAVSRLSFRP